MKRHEVDGQTGDRAKRAPAGFEELESRRMLSATLSGSTLVINGGKHWDVITVTRAGKAGLIVDVNGEEQTFSLTSVKKFKIAGGRGDDSITVGTLDRPISVAAVITGNEGNDTIWSG